MDLDLLATFIDVIDSGSFTAAARKRGVPKSSISRAVTKLEADTGARLLHRSTRKVSPTSAGTELYARASPHVLALRDAVRAVPERDTDPSGLLRVTAPSDLSGAFLADAVARYVSLYPAASVELILTNRTVDLVGEGIDVALRGASKLQDSSLVARRLMKIEGVLCAAPSYVTRRGSPRTVRELEAHDWITHAVSRSRIRMQGPSESTELKLRPRVRCDDFNFFRDALRTGTGIGVLPMFLATEDLATGRLVRLLPRYSASSGSLYLVHAAATPTPRKITSFRDAILETLSQRHNVSPVDDD